MRRRSFCVTPNRSARLPARCGFVPRTATTWLSRMRCRSSEAMRSTLVSKALASWRSLAEWSTTAAPDSDLTVMGPSVLLAALGVCVEGMQVDKMRTLGFPADMGAPLFLFRDDAPLKAHAGYQAAKSGDPAAAVRLVMDLAEPLVNKVKAAIESNVIFVAPHAREAPGDNAIPQVLARALASATGAEADRDIVQRTRVFHTGADPMERLNNRAHFDGPVRKGAGYVLVDDVMTMGGTLAELAHHLQSAGGMVAGLVVLVNAARSGLQTPAARVTALLERRHGDAIREIFQIDPAALTAEESQYLIGFRTVDELRNRSLTARQETDRRLRSKAPHRLGGEAG
jgi:adenine/guanine phosphoribosyltransferase-like PRPP-binding protein